MKPAAKTRRPAPAPEPSTSSAMPARGRSTTIKHVAAAAGVSLKTVSRVINADPAVTPATSDRVRAAIEQLGWRPHPLARSLRSPHAHALGLVYDNPNAHYVVSLQEGVLAACRERGFGLQIHPCSAAQPQLTDELLNLVRAGRLAGLVLAPPMSERVALVAALLKQGVPLARLVSGADGPPPRAGGQDCLRVDDCQAARAVTEHLIQLGHTRIGFLWGHADHGSSPQRHAGYLEAHERYGLAVDASLVLPGDYSFESGFRGARALLALGSPPTAIFGSNDEIASGALAAARSLGLEVPWDLSVAGFEDSPFSRQAWPALTTARQSPREIGHRAAQCLIDRVQRTQQDGAPPPPSAQSFVPELVMRASTAPPRRAERASVPAGSPRGGAPGRR